MKDLISPFHKTLRQLVLMHLDPAKIWDEHVRDHGNFQSLLARHCDWAHCAKKDSE